MVLWCSGAPVLRCSPSLLQNLSNNLLKPNKCCTFAAQLPIVMMRILSKFLFEVILKILFKYILNFMIDTPVVVKRWGFLVFPSKICISRRLLLSLQSNRTSMDDIYSLSEEDIKLRYIVDNN